MAKFAGYSLITSFTSFYDSITLRNCHKFSFAMCHNTIIRSSSTYTQKVHLHKKNGDNRYPPPLFSVAPMMDWTDTHYRTLARLISKHAWLYTEMLAAETIVYQEENLDKFLEFTPEQHPVVLQIGGNNLKNIAKATQLAHSYGYDEINLKLKGKSNNNFTVICVKSDFLDTYGGIQLWMPEPKSSRTWMLWCSPYAKSKGKFVAEAMSVIADNTDVPVSVKCRIGLDDHDSYNELCDFIYKVYSQSPTRHFIIHSRKALLNGISPADNRRIPPLKYEYYYALLRDFPDLTFTINGGINCVAEVKAALREGAHGVMVGRAAYYNPWNILAHVDTEVYGSPCSGVTRRKVLEQYQVYADSILGKYGKDRPNVRDLSKHVLNFFHSEPGNGQFKRNADAAFRHCTTMKSFLEETLVAIPDWVLDKTPGDASSGREDLFDNVESLLPPPYKSEGIDVELEREAQYA
ncbi:hypothetical protein ACFE04_000581 [Oxalis oulophora]